MNEQEMKEKGLAVYGTAQGLMIETENDYANAANLLKDIKSNVRDIETFFKDIKGNAHIAWKAIVAKEKGFTDKLAESEKLIKSSMGIYVQKVEAVKKIESDRIRAEEMRIWNEQEKLHKELLAEAELLKADGHIEEAEMFIEEAKIEVPIFVEQIVDIPTTKVSGISQIKDYEISILDGNLIPIEINGIEVRPVDLAKIKQIVKMTKGKAIPGVEIREIIRIGSR